MSSKPDIRQSGVTLIEMIVTIVLFTVMASFGALLVGKLSPSYLLSAETEQAMSARQAALWRIAEDFRKALLDGTYQTNCLLRLNSVSEVTGANSEVVTSRFVEYEWFATTHQLWMSDAQTTSALLLANVELPAGVTCPLAYASGVERARLLVNFKHYSDGTDRIGIPVSTTYFTFVNGPYVASAVLAGGAVSTVTVTGYFSGFNGGVISNVAFFPTAQVSATIDHALTNTTQIVANISAVAATWVSISVATPEGYSSLKQAFQFP